MKIDAVDVLQKPVDPETLLGAISRALALDMKAQKWRSARRYSRELHERFGHLTSREWAVFIRVLEGKANKAIAHELELAERTVKVYRLMTNLGVRSSAELGALAEQLRNLAE